MPYTFTIPNDYGYVILTATSSFLLNLAHILKTGARRGPSQVAYPYPYAYDSHIAARPAEAYALNCAQRAHANFTENHLSALAAMCLGGLAYPRVAAGLGAGWVVSRWLYLQGYTSGGPETKGLGRYRGVAFWGFQAGLIGLAGWVGVGVVMGW